MHLGSWNQLSFDLMIVAQFKCDFPLIWEWRAWRRLIVNCIFSQSRNSEMRSENDSRHDRAKLSQKATNSENKKLYINFKWSYSSNLIEQNSNYTPVSAPSDNLSQSHSRDSSLCGVVGYLYDNDKGYKTSWGWAVPSSGRARARYLLPSQLLRSDFGWVLVKPVKAIHPSNQLC